MSTEMCVNGVCQPKLVQGANFVQSPSKPIQPVLMNTVSQDKKANVITGEDALRIKGEYDKNNLIVDMSRLHDSTLKSCTRR